MSLPFPKDLPMPDGMPKAQILQILQREEYGFVPKVPVSVTAALQDMEVQFCAQKAIFKQLRLILTMPGAVYTFPVNYVYPSRAKESFPCFIFLNFTSQVPDRYYPAEEIIDSGFGVLSFNYADITEDDDNFRSGLARYFFPDGHRRKDDPGKIALWAWAASRVMDHALTLPEIRHDRISVIGHSRLGKTALLAGALDERFFMAISNDSGSSGASLARGNTGETVSSIVNQFPYWFCENFSQYAGCEEQMPFDQHFLIAANVPHRVYVGDAEEDTWGCPRNQYLACAAADGFYRENGLPGFVHPDRLPKAGDIFTKGYIGYHMREGSHYLSREDWQHYLACIQATL